MKFRLLCFAFFVLIFSCRAKDPQVELRADLKKTMQDFLYNSVNNDSSNVTYRVNDVAYFEETDMYVCEFTVYMKTKLFDTTGIMKANITKDLKKVDRLY